MHSSFLINLYSMAAVLTTTMTLRVILSVRGTLAAGGTYSGISSGQPTSSSAGGVPSRQVKAPTHQSQVGGAQLNGHTYTIEEMRAKAERDWVDEDRSEEGKYVIDGNESDGRITRSGGSYPEEKATLPMDGERAKNPGGIGVKVTIDKDFK